MLLTLSDIVSVTNLKKQDSFQTSSLSPRLNLDPKALERDCWEDSFSRAKTGTQSIFSFQHGQWKRIFSPSWPVVFDKY